MMTMDTWKQAEARDFDAGFVMKELDPRQQYMLVQGLVQGLGYARFLRDRPDERGMVCIQQWLFKEEGTKRWKIVEAFFRKHPDKPPAALVHALIKQECGT